MDNLTEASQIDQYVEALEECYNEAKRKHDKDVATVTARQQDYNRANAYYSKIKSYWDKAQETNLLGKEVYGNINNTGEIIKVVKQTAQYDTQAIEFLSAELRSISLSLEDYEKCVEELNKEIDNIKDSKLDKTGGIVGALKDLEAAYEEAIDAANAALKAILTVLEETYRMSYFIQKPDPLINPCDPSVDDQPGASSDGTGENGCEKIFFSGLFGSIYAESETGGGPVSGETVDTGMIWAYLEDFPLEEKCDYYKTLETEFVSAKTQKDEAFDELFSAKNNKEQAKSKMEALKKSWQAADKANKC